MPDFPWKVHHYQSYDRYVANQTLANKKKIDNVWVHNTTIAAIVNWYIRNNGAPATKILCHGTRNAAEQSLFRRFTEVDIEVLGTEISETATQFPDTIQWDFSRQKPEWVGYWDIVYSNSFDHTPTPIKTIRAWRDQIKDNGLLVIDHSVWNNDRNNKPNRIDCLDISFESLENLIQDNGMKIVTRKQYNTTQVGKKLNYDSWFYFIRKVL